jgi:hypothetical protein
MANARTWRSWVTPFSLIAALDLFVRFALPFSLGRVLIVEAGLFLGAALVTRALIAQPPLRSGWRRVVQLSLMWAFGLAALRAAIWAAGQPVMRANLATFVAAILLLIGSRLWRRQSKSSSDLGPYAR